MNTGYNPNDAIKRQITYRFLLLCFIIGAATGTSGDLVPCINRYRQISEQWHISVFAFSACRDTGLGSFSFWRRSGLNGCGA